MLDETARLGLCQLHLPQLSTRSTREKHVTILCQPPNVLKERKRVLVVINDIHQDLGIWSYRYLGRDGGGLLEGTAAGIAAELIERSICKDKSNGTHEKNRGINEWGWKYKPSFRENVAEKKSPDGKRPSRLRMAIQANDDLKSQLGDVQDAWGLVVLNPGQLLFSHSFGTAIGHASWNALPRPSAVHPPVRKDFEANFVPGNSTPEEHIRFVFSNIIDNPSFVAPHAEVSVIANGSVCAPFVQMLDEKCMFVLTSSTIYRISKLLRKIANKYLQILGYAYKHKIEAIALLQPSIEEGDVLDFDLAQFLKSNARSWEASEAEVGTLIASAETGDDAIIDTKLNKLTLDVNEDDIEGQSADSASDSSDVVMQRKVVCPTYSGGVYPWEELILPTVYKRVLDFLEASDDHSHNESSTNF